MNPVEFAVSLLAPHRCIVCKQEGAPVCRYCATATFKGVRPSCYRCGIASAQFATCETCQHRSPLVNAWVGTHYSGVAKELIGQLKFQRVKAAAQVVACFLDECLPRLPPNILISPIPTANTRIRMRGYDQASLIARALAYRRNVPYIEVLRRTQSTRQVGSTRQQRFRQLNNAFGIHNPSRVLGANILLIDDILTTGATVETAAKNLHNVGAETVAVAVFARADDGRLTKPVSSSNTKSDLESHQ